jgi:hypothetical protein
VLLQSGDGVCAFHGFHYGGVRAALQFRGNRATDGASGFCARCRNK